MIPLSQALQAVSIRDAVGIAQCVRAATDPVFRLYPMQQHHADLRTEARSQVDGVLDGIGTTFRQVQLSEFGINFLEVGNRGHAAGFKRFDGDDIFDAGAHGMTGETLGVGDHDAIRDIAEDAAKRVDLGGGTASPSRSIGFMGNENCLWGDLASRNAALRFSFGHQGFHDLPDVLDIETSAVEGAVVRRGGQHFTDRLYAACTRDLGALYYQSCGAHADQHAVPSTVEGNGGICNHFVGGGGSSGQEARTHPLDQMVRSYVVG